MSAGAWRAVGALLLVVLLIIVGAAAAWRVQDWRYGKQLAEQARMHADTLNQLSQTAAIAQRAEQDKRLAIEQRLAASEQTHFRKMSDVQRDQDRLLLLICGCQYSSTQPRLPKAVECQPPPPPAAWIMQPYEADLTRRMLNELSPSPTKATGD